MEHISERCVLKAELSIMLMQIVLSVTRNRNQNTIQTQVKNNNTTDCSKFSSAVFAHNNPSNCEDHLFELHVLVMKVNLSWKNNKPYPWKSTAELNGNG